MVLKLVVVVCAFALALAVPDSLVPDVAASAESHTQQAGNNVVPVPLVNAISKEALIKVDYYDENGKEKKSEEKKEDNNNNNEPEELPTNNAEEKDAKPEGPANKAQSEAEVELTPEEMEGGYSDKPQNKPQDKPQDKPHITKAFFLNLDKDQARRQHMEEELNKQGLAHERVPGVTVKDIRNGEWKHLYPKGILDPSQGDNTQHARSWACDVAHRVAFETVSKQPPGLYLVLEDDIAFKDGWKDTFARIWADVPKDKRMARIGYWGKTDSKDKVNNDWYVSNRHIDYWDENNAYYYGAHAIVLDPEGASQLLEEIKKHQAIFADKFTADGVVGPSYVSVENLVTVNEEVWGSTKNQVKGDKHTPSKHAVLGKKPELPFGLNDSNGDTKVGDAGAVEGKAGDDKPSQ